MSVLLEISSQSFKWPQYSKGLKRFLEDKREKALASSQLEKFRDPCYDPIRDEIQNLLNEKISVQFFKTIPGKEIGYGSESQVFACEDRNKMPAVLKLYAEGYDYAYRPGQDASCPETVRRLRSFIPVTRMLLSSPQSPHLLQAKGLGYYEPAKRWGIVFEKIDGKGWAEVCKSLTPETGLPAVINMLLGAAKGFQILDDAKWSYNDLGEQNFMIRSSDGSAVVIDIPRVSRFEPKNPMQLRQAFGFLCSQNISKDFVKKSPSLHAHIPMALKVLAEECKSGKSMQKFDWGRVIDALEYADREVHRVQNN